MKKYFGKGQLVCVCGSIRTRSWEEDGKKRFITEIVANEIYFTGDKNTEKDETKETSNGGFISVDDDELPF